MATNVHTTTPVPHENDPPRNPSVGYSAHEDAAQLRTRTHQERTRLKAAAAAPGRAPTASEHACSRARSSLSPAASYGTEVSPASSAR